ncbi:MAG: MFS transporter [Hyphomicrobiales bacterium]|nr:MFS transporter [Hyphomicrobiales bacterium]
MNVKLAEVEGTLVSSAVAEMVPARRAAASAGPVMLILGAVSLSHFLNDMLQSLLPAMYPLLKSEFSLSFAEVGLITLVFQLTGSVLQPIIGTYTDRHPLPYSASLGMISSLSGLLLLSVAGNLPMLLVAAALVGIGSAVFHPESSRMARAASGGRYGLAQSLFQVGGNFGTSSGPLLAALVVVPLGRSSVAGFIVVPMLAMGILFFVGRWYAQRLAAEPPRASGAKAKALPLPRAQVTRALLVLMALMFSKFFYTASMTTFYTFYLIHKFQLPIGEAQLGLFAYLFAFASGTLIGGPLGDRYGRLPVIWISIVGALPLTLAMPYANLPGTIILSMLVGFVISSAFSTIVVYAQELLPGRVGMVSGLFFGLAFGMGGLGAGSLGMLADHTSVDFVFHLCAFLPAIGFLTWFLPKLGQPKPEKLATQG